MPQSKDGKMLQNVPANRIIGHSGFFDSGSKYFNTQDFEYTVHIHHGKLK